MTGPVKSRGYRSALRQAQAQATRQAILVAARDLFVAEGYGCTLAAVANRAGVAVDTIYATVGRKPQLVRAVIDMVLGSSDQPIPADQRDYVRHVRAARTAEDKLRIYADALQRVLPTIAPLQQALRQAGETDDDCRQAWRELVDRRAANMLLLARDLRRTNQLRADLDDRQVADIIWSTNSAEYYSLLQQRGWTIEQFTSHLIDLWTKLLLTRTDLPDKAWR